MGGGASQALSLEQVVGEGRSSHTEGESFHLLKEVGGKDVTLF